MDAPRTFGPPRQATFHDIPYEKRWDYLKDIIVKAFLGDATSSPLTFPKLSEFMKKHHGFDASPTQYRYRLCQWNIRKNTKKVEKTAAITALGKRNRVGGSTSDVKIRQGGSMMPMDSKQVKRFINDSIRHHSVPSLIPGIVSQWNLPYIAYRASLGRQDDQSSPFNCNPPTPQYLQINSPEASACQASDMSPGVALVRRKTMLDRTLADWLHDYWMYCFVRAKFWGTGPQEWTAGMVSQFTLGSVTNETPLNSRSPSAMISGQSSSGSRRVEAPRPTQLCHWAIHHRNTVHYEFLPSSPRVEQESFDLGDQSSWTAWTDSQRSQSYQNSIHEAFIHNRFSTTAPEEVPIACEVVSEVISTSDMPLALDSLAFAIMAGNIELISKTLSEMRLSAKTRILDFTGIYPYHLAASFLDGGRTCCLMLHELTMELQGYHYPIALNNLDSNEHTVLDCLMISVLRSHTNLSPAEVSTSSVQCTRFPGEEKDICGRWDANSPELRQLYKSGQAKIPDYWKHNFCHSSVQAVCHSMMAILLPSSRPNINIVSGLFRRRCTSCGLEMKLGPLHTLVAVAFHLAENGKSGETLFGALACLVCLLVLGADPAQVADLSVLDIFSSPDEEVCLHRPMTALELADQVPRAVSEAWGASSKLGWKCLLLVLRHTTPSSQQHEQFMKFSFKSNMCCQLHDDEDRDEILDERDRSSLHDERGECPLIDAHEDIGLPPVNQNLGVLWATIQTELLTYRKVNVNDAAISDRFQLSSLLSWLEGGSDTFETPLLTNGIMKSHTPCGWFNGRASPFAVTASDVCSEYFMNMDIWSRASFIEEMIID
ncbi:hypothetical protein CPAR01_01599 [Colletotrichum paranaense]|uniref:Clr5 domain-containing protein n=1 Tax=Colletotrichum paranaense TaxID=1914294 RepID=A0ABQ9T775_9PEZI|nr:uncharacterized protein CPAR01_01599 [Colletotrichum paranaense]KAK1547632.1 hypothetical protein CPAR01_01599 [Colletotrichum paranaense]